MTATERYEAGEPALFDITLDILGYQEDGEWVALALDMDLRGYGATWDDALKELHDLVVAQVAFAHSKGQPEMIWREAEERYHHLFRQARTLLLFQTTPEAPPDLALGEMRLHAGGLAIPPAHVSAALREQFSRATPANG